MTRASSFFPFPFDASFLWDMGTNPLDFAYWFDAAGELQSQTVEFLNSRLAKNAATIAKLAQCRTPLEILGVQADYATEVFADFVTEAQKIAGWSESARESLLSGDVKPGSQEPEGSHRHPMYRTAGH